MVKPTVISTFAGCGGSSLGYQQAGYKELLAVEWDDNAVKTFKANFPGIPVYHGDISKLGLEECLELSGVKPGELDVLDGSPPCQGFSTSGKRKMSDPRNSLFMEFCRLLKGLKPKVFVVENVTGMVKGHMKQVFLDIMKTLRECGYDCVAQVMNAKWYGVPQARQRVIIIGTRKDLKKPPGHPKPTTKPIVASAAIDGLPIDDLYLFPTPLAKKWWGLCLPGKSFSSVHPKGHWFNQQKAHPHKPFPTLTKSVFVNGGAGIAHWDYPGQLSIAMAKRVASFPDSFELFGKFQDQWARVGNSVPPKLMEAIAIHIRDNFLNGSNDKRNH
jgi:DNA (cytosine-5)-methyltransferase 1